MNLKITTWLREDIKMAADLYLPSLVEELQIKLNKEAGGKTSLNKHMNPN